MKSKRIIRFYFSAEKLNSALDNLIMAEACRYEGGGEFYAQKVIDLIEVKKKLARLWEYLDGVISAMSGKDRAVLCFYAGLRRGAGGLEERQRREIKRVTVKFRRRARFLFRFAYSLKLVDEYYAFL